MMNTESGPQLELSGTAKKINLIQELVESPRTEDCNPNVSTEYPSINIKKPYLKVREK